MMQRTSLWALLFSILFWGCADARLSADGFTQAFDDENPTGPRRPGPGGGSDADAGAGTGVPVGEPFRPPPGELRCVLIPSVGGDLFVGVDSTLTFGVYQFSIETGAIMPAEPVEFAILPGSVEGRLSSERVRTDEQGLARVRLDAGSEPGTLTVRAFSPCANSLDLEIDVLELPTGNVRVTFNYPFRDVYLVSNLTVDVFPTDEVSCRDIMPGERPAGWALTQTAPTLDDAVLFNALDVSQAFTFVVNGIGRAGERAAQGCVDNIIPREGITTELRVDLFLLPLDPVGTYDLLANYDFRDALADSGPAGALIVRILDLFVDPGRGLVDFLLDLVRDFVGGLIGFVVDTFIRLTGLDRVIADAINDVINRSPFLSSIVTIGRDLRSIIADLEVISRLEIGKLGSNFEVFGIDIWQGLALYWRLGCDATSPPDCGRLPIVLDTIDLGVLRGEWTGRVLGYNRLDIDRYPIDFQYGRLILYALEYLVLPTITGRPGPVTLEDLMALIINCPGLGAAIAGGPGRCRCALGACLCADDVERFCRSFISLTFGGLFRTFINALSFDSVLNIRGNCRLINDDDQIDVDELRAGQYIGDMTINGALTPFSGRFCGVRQGRDVVAACLGRE